MLCPFFSSFDRSSKNAGGLELIPHNKRSNPSHRFLEIGQNICIDMALVVHAMPYSLRYLCISWVSEKWVFCAERLGVKPDREVKNKFLLFFISYHFQNVIIAVVHSSDCKSWNYFFFLFKKLPTHHVKSKKVKLVKVSQSRNQIMMASILPKNH